MLRKSILLLSLAFSSILHAADVIEGQHYKVLRPPILTTVPQEQIEVLEFFSYGCPHCAALEPIFVAWEKNQPKHVTIKRIPVEFNPTWAAYVKLYYVAESLHVAHKMAMPLFSAVQVERLNVADPAVAEKLFVAQGVDAKKFKAAYNSRIVATKMVQANTLTKHYKVDRVPLIFINGKYQTNLSMAGGPEGLKTTLNFLLAEIEKSKQAANKTKTSK